MEVIKTNNSSLLVHELDEPTYNLLVQSIEYVEARLVKNPTIRMWGKECHQHRSVGFFSNGKQGYNYSTTKTPPIELNEALEELLGSINRQFDSDFNGILINKYETGRDYIGKHSDDMRGVDSNAGVIALSFGTARIFRIRDKETGKKVKDVVSDSNTIIQMKGNFQNEFTHEVPVQAKVSEPRYSFTFRKHL